MELWKQVSSHPNYEVSNTGKVRNIKTGRILKQCTSRNGYLHVNLTHNRKPKFFNVHSLVAHAFKGNQFFNGAEVNHISGDKNDNSASNLEFITHAENIKLAWRNGLIKSTPKIDYSDAVRIRELKSEQWSHQQLANRFGISVPTVSKIINNKSWKKTTYVN